MSKNIRFKGNTTDSFFGNFLYDQVLDKKHFLVKAKEIVDWGRFTKRCLKWYKGQGQYGAAPYNPSVLLRMLFVSYLYNFSERETETMINDSISMKCFLDLGIDQLAPDHSTLTYFKERLLFGGGKSAYDELLREILNQALDKGIKFGSVHVIDSTHTIANVNTDKDKQRLNKGQKPRDPESRWGVKHQREVKDPATGEVKKQIEYFHGFKGHTSLNTKTNLITAVTTTSGNAYDNKQFSRLVHKDNQTKGLVRSRTYAADKAYDDGEIHELLKDKKLGNAINLRSTRKAERWLKLKETKEWREGRYERYKVERKFAEGKLSHGLRRCRYLGLVKYHAQLTLTAVILNLKVVVASMTGSTLKGYAYTGNSVWSNST